MTNTVKKISLLFASHFKKALVAFCFVVVLLTPQTSYSALINIDVGGAYSQDEYLKYCGPEHFDEKYSAASTSCWSCNLIQRLMECMTTTANTLSKNTQELGLLILIWGSALWLAAYFLRSLGSATAQDPAKVLDGAITFMFKVALIYILIDLGLPEIVDKIVNPLLSIGFDIGQGFAESA